MTRNQQITCLAVAMLASWPGSAQAATVVETVPSTISLHGNGSVTFNFADLTNANQFVSATGGSVTAGEGGTTSVAVDYVDGSTYTLFTGFYFDFSSIPATSFPIGTINGLTFTTNYYYGVDQLSIPAGTTFSFNTVPAAVPEPASWALMLMGFGAIGYSISRHRKGSLAVA